MKKYRSLLVSFLKNNLIREMEFRGNFFLLITLDIVWVFFQVLIIQIMFQFTDSILGWTKFQIFFLIGFFRFVKGAFDTFIRLNLFLFPSLVTKGDLDLILTKPVNVIFMISTRKQDFVEFGSSIAGLAVMIYAGFFLKLTLEPVLILTLILAAICSFLAFYSVFFMFVTIAFFVPRMTALRPCYDLITNFARFPGQLFTQGRLIYEIVLIPIFLISTIPVEVVLKKAPSYFLIFEVIGTTLLVALGIWFWNFSIKHYASASS